jgi:hypothetical protein
MWGDLRLYAAVPLASMAVSMVSPRTGMYMYLLLAIEIYLATYTIGTFHLSYWRFGPTELRILLVIGNLFALRNPYAHIAGRDFLLVASILAKVTVAVRSWCPWKAVSNWQAQ